MNNYGVPHFEDEDKLDQDDLRIVWQMYAKEDPYSLVGRLLRQLEATEDDVRELGYELRALYDDMG